MKKLLKNWDRYAFNSFFYNQYLRIKTIIQLTFFLLSSLRRIKFIFRLYFKTNQTRFFLFFNQYDTIGGAEIIHIAIADILKEQKAILFFVDKQRNANDLKVYFDQRNSFILDKLFYDPHASEILIRLVAWFIKLHKKTVVLGSASIFLHKLIPFLNNKSRNIELIHNLIAEKNGFDKFRIQNALNIHQFIFTYAAPIEVLKNLLSQNQLPIPKISTVFPPINKIQNYVVKNDEPFTIIFVGRDSPEKRIYLIAKVAKKIHQKYPNICFKFIGDIQSLPPHPAYSLEGYTTDKTLLGTYYQKAHVILLLSFTEGFSLVVAEGMSRGVVPISTDVGGISKGKLIDKYNGFLIENYADEDKIILEAVAYIEMLYQNKRLYRKMSLRAFKIAQTLPNIAEMQQAYRRILLKE